MSGVEIRLQNIVKDRKRKREEEYAEETEEQLEAICEYFESNPERESMHWERDTLTSDTIKKLRMLGFAPGVHEDGSWTIAVNVSK